MDKDKYIGRLLDNRYEILELIGTGGMAVVYKARCHRLNRLVAIKILKDDFLEDEEFRRRFHSESQAVAMLSHPNIISVYDVSTSITADYIVMELIDGITLKQYMEKKGVLNWKETLHFAIQIAKALEHAHSRGIVHRDIKPHNVMVLKNGSVKVTDFGIARMMSKGNTLTKEALGSVHYISPEQAKGGRVDNRSDIYSLGVVMYEMMSGRPPYDGESPVSVAIQHINGGAAMPSTLNPNIPGGLEQIIMRAMAHEPSNRYATATQMLADLDEFRKDPAILFDYNTPPTDVVTNMPKPPVVEEKPEVPTIAENKARVGSADTPARPARRTPGTQPDSGRRQVPPQRRRPRVDEEEARKNKITTIAIISCAAVMVVAIIIFLVVLLGSDTQVEVPNLVGRNYEFIDEKSLGFKIQYEEAYDDEVEAGKIISQDPPAGTKVVKGHGTVFVTVSKGPKVETIYMPDVTGKTKEEAKEELKKLPIQITYNPVVEQSHETVEAGKIIKTDPDMGAELSAKQTVTLYISTGPEVRPGTMPSVVGSTLADAQQRLDDQNLHLDIKVEEVFDDTVIKGNVISVEPAEGQEITTGMTVTIKVSKGPQVIVMPNYVNFEFDKARAELIEEGYKKEYMTRKDEYHPTIPEGVIISQSVDAQTEIPVNQPIEFVVSKGPEPTGPASTSVRKEHAVTFTTLPTTDCYIEVYDINNKLVAKEQVLANATGITVTIEGNYTGMQQFFYYFTTGTEESGDHSLAGNFVVNFDE